MFGRRTTTDIPTPTRAISSAKDGAVPAKAAEAKPALVEANRAARPSRSRRRRSGGTRKSTTTSRRRSSTR